MVLEPAKDGGKQIATISPLPQNEHTPLPTHESPRLRVEELSKAGGATEQGPTAQRQGNH